MTYREEPCIVELFDVQKEMEDFVFLEAAPDIADQFHVIDQEQLEREYTNYIETQNSFKISQLPPEIQEKIEEISKNWPKFGMTI